MDISFEGYAAQAATFYADDAVLPGSAVMLGENLTVYPVEENADILGVALAVRDGCATVQTAGAVRLPCSSTLYEGFTPLTVDSEGRVIECETGPVRLVLSIDRYENTAIIML